MQTFASDGHTVTLQVGDRHGDTVDLRNVTEPHLARMLTLYTIINNMIMYDNLKSLYCVCCHTVTVVTSHHTLQVYMTDHNIIIKFNDIMGPPFELVPV